MVFELRIVEKSARIFLASIHCHFEGTVDVDIFAQAVGNESKFAAFWYDVLRRGPGGAKIKVYRGVSFFLERAWRNEQRCFVSDYRQVNGQ